MIIILSTWAYFCTVMVDSSTQSLLGTFLMKSPIRYGYLASHILTPHIISAYSSSMDAQALGYYIAFDGLFSLVSVIVSLYFLQ